jgi:NitT/TauT family transport system ATP-binding protein
MTLTAVQHRGIGMKGSSVTRAEAPGPPVLVAKDLRVTYKAARGPVPALEGLSLSVRRGEFVSILGPSGCGKSTLLKVVSGLIAPSAGEIVLEGTPVNGPRPDVGIVFQQPTLLPWKTVLGNVLVPCQALRRDSAQSRAAALALLKLVGLEGFIDRYPGELSGGMQQRVGLARGLVHDPSLLLMDEPFAALDAMTRERMAGELQRIWMQANKSIIFITHSIPEAVFLSDRILVLSSRPGRLIDEIAVDLPRPRGVATMSSPQFGKLCHRLRALFGASAGFG